MIETALIVFAGLSIVLLVLLLRVRRELSGLEAALQSHLESISDLEVVSSGKLDVQQKRALLEKSSLLRKIADLKDQLATSKADSKDQLASLVESIDVAAQELKRVESREEGLKTQIANSLSLNETAQELVEQAVPLIQNMNGVPGRSGPNKREYVYKQMVKDNPAADLRDISLAIEKGIQEVN